MDTINVVIIGGLHHNTLGVVRSLGECKESHMNMRVLLVGEGLGKTNFISKSRYLKAGQVSCVDSEQGIVSWLLKLAEDGRRRVIVCCADKVAETVIANRDLLSPYYAMPATSMDVTELMNKEVQNDLAVACGMRVPVGRVFSTSDEQALEWNDFPCIIKPVKSAMGAGKKDICICADKRELSQVLTSIEADVIQIQRYLDKKMEFQLIGCSLDGGKEIIIPGYTDIIRQPPNTNTGYLKYSPIAGLRYDAQAVTNFIRKIGYSGLFSVEFIRDDQDNDYFLEINMRNDGNAYCVKSAGVNLPYIWCYYQTYHQLPDVPVTFEKPVYFIPDFVDARLGIQDKGLFGWLGQFFAAKSHAVYHKRDIKPFLFQAKQYGKHIFKR